MGENKVVTTYKLDGTESKNTMMGRGGTPMESVSTAKWDGSKLDDHDQAGHGRRDDGVHVEVDASPAAR